MYDLEKKYFKLTLDTFRTFAAKDNNQLLERFEAIHAKIIESKQINEVDLFELASDYKGLEKKTIEIKPMTQNNQEKKTSSNPLPKKTNKPKLTSKIPQRPETPLEKLFKQKNIN